jgi:hypothetical protein
MFQSVETMLRAIESTQAELDIIRHRGWNAWENYYEAFLEEEHRAGYIATLEAQRGLLERELNRRT